MTCLSNSGYQTGECIRATAARDIAVARLAAMTLIAVDNARRAVENFRAQYDIAKRGLTLAQEQQGQLENVFWPREEQFLNEFANPDANRDGVESIETAEVLSRRYAGRLVAAVAGKFAKQIREMRCNAPRYNTSALKKALQDLLLMRSEAIASARILGRNIAFAEIKVREDTDWNRRGAAIVMGRGLMADAGRLLGAASESLGNAGAAALAGLNGALGDAGASFKEAMQAQQIIDNPGSSASLPWTSMWDASMTAPSGSIPGSALGQSSWTQSVGLGHTSTSLDSTTQSNDSIDNGFFNQNAFNPSVQQRVPESAGHEMQMQRGNVGYQDLVRTGSVTYPLQNVTSGAVTINLSDFPLAYADGETQSVPLLPTNSPYTFAYPPPRLGF